MNMYARLHAKPDAGASLVRTVTLLIAAARACVQSLSMKLVRTVVDSGSARLRAKPENEASPHCC